MRLIAAAAALMFCAPALADPLPQYIISGGNQVPEIVEVPCSIPFENGEFERDTCYLHSMVTIGGNTIVAFQRSYRDYIEVFSTDGVYQVRSGDDVLVETEVRVLEEECDPALEYEWRLEIMVDSEYWTVFCLGA